MNKTESLIAKNKIVIISGEGETGITEEYTGKRSIRAIKTRLTKERCNGDRWAKAIVFSHSSEYGNVHVNIESGEYC